MSSGGTPEPTDTRHVFTVDVEEYFQVHAFEDLVHVEEWDCFPSRVARSTDRLLELLDESGARATFFVLGWVAERHPAVVRRVAEAGHEVASHSYWHHRVGELSPDEFREDARKARAVLEQITGQRVLGYRAPSFSLVEGTEWMLDVLAEEGYRYDSSLFPARKVGRGGYPGGGRFPRLVDTGSGRLLELPLTTARWAGVTLPAAGGAYLRHLPYRLIRSGLRQFEAEGQPGVFYIHPWELDPDQPKIPGSLSSRVRHYRNLDRTEGLLERVLGEFEFTSARERFGLDEGGESRPASEPRDTRPGRPSRRAGS